MQSFDGAKVKSLEMVYQTPDVVGQRARVLDLLAPAAGERILDVGVGPGLLAYDLARLVGEAGALAGIDLSADMVAVAAQRLAEFPQAKATVGDATKLDFADAAFDAAVSTQVYEYVPDLPRALRELHRVLRPGGRALILDTDWRSIVWHSSDPARTERILAAWDAHLFEPHLPAKLGPMLRTAGFEVRRVEIIPMLTPRWQPVSYVGGMMRTIHAFVRNHTAENGLDPAEVEAWRDDQLALAERGEFFFSLNRYAFVAVR